jgi:hypothetical protein
MKYKIFTTFLIAASMGSVFAQTADVVSTTGGTKDVYYQLSSGNKVEATGTSWHFAFTTLLVDASVLSNDIAGVAVYMVSEDVANWDKIDTTGKLNQRIYNGEKSWNNGAFSNLGGMHPDYGWGSYNQSTHNLSAKRVFVVKLPNGDYKRMIIDKMETTGNVAFRIADMDGSNVISKSFNKNNYKSRNFVHYNLNLDSFIEYEAESIKWELCFTKYFSEVAPGAQYPVTGVKINRDIKIAQRDNMMVTSNDTSTITYGDNITEIGADWKTYNMIANKYDITQDRAYFLKLKNNDVWKVYFTDYAGGPAGSFSFTKQLLVGTGAAGQMDNNNVVVYPNPANDKITLLTDATTNNWTINMIDFSGKTVFAKQGNAAGFIQNTIEVSSFNKGFYIVEFTDGQIVVRKKVQIQ